ncbi:MAG: DUF4405 domain-containing protein [Bacteroidales bacterium]|nr:DUF4405 domain-containing protein [Bacteroidales bacterium]MBN2749352.1 DUF4405 domain-containing protein [Bacteroidales bacterium]
MIKGLKKLKVNIIIDLALLVLLALMAGIGFLIKQVLVSGAKQNLIYGTNIHLEFLGLDRHQWGSIHLIVSIVFIVLIAVHVLLHWDVILCILNKMIPNKWKRYSLIAAIALTSTTFFCGPFFVSAQMDNHKNYYRNRIEHTTNYDTVENSTYLINKTRNNTQNSNSTHIKQSSSEARFETNGKQTIEELSALHSIPADYICKQLQIPLSSKDQRLGRLRKKYGFTMTEVSSAIASYKHQQ